MNNTTEPLNLKWWIDITEGERQLIAFAVCSLNNTPRRFELSVWDQAQLEKLAKRFDWNKP
jgi:hypothetical protein